MCAFDSCIESGQDVNAAYKEIESEIVARISERIGDDRFDLWFEGDKSFFFDGQTLTVRSIDLFSQDRIKQSYVSDVRIAAEQAIGHMIEIQFQLTAPEVLVGAEKHGQSEGILPARKLELIGVGAECGLPSRMNQDDGHVSHEDSDKDCWPRSMAIVPESPGIVKFRYDKGEAQPVSEIAKEPWALENFCFGNNNLLLQSAVNESVHGVACQFSPLYVYGPVGCGKTHLLRGMVSAFRQQRKMSRCIYLTSEQFTSNFIQAIDGRGVSDFRRKCRGLDVMAIDDIQFFGGKKATLIEFQSTIEALIRNGKTIILAGDCSLAELRCFEPELVNRIAGGLPCPINYVDSHGRKMILQHLAKIRGVNLSPEVIDHFAENLSKDVRHLSGALNRIQAAQMAGLQIATIDQVHPLILDLIQASSGTITIREIEAAVEEYSGIPARELRSDSRCKSTSTARALAMFLSRQMTGSAFSEIGNHFGGRSHSTVISANNKIQNWMERNHFVSFNQIRCNINDVVHRIESKLRTG